MKTCVQECIEEFRWCSSYFRPFPSRGDFLLCEMIGRGSLERAPPVLLVFNRTQMQATKENLSLPSIHGSRSMFQVFAALSRLCFTMAPAPLRKDSNHARRINNEARTIMFLSQRQCPSTASWKFPLCNCSLTFTFVMEAQELHLLNCIL